MATREQTWMVPPKQSRLPEAKKRKSNISQVRSGSQFPKPTLLSLGIIKANGWMLTWLKPWLMTHSHSEAESQAKPAAARSQTCPRGDARSCFCFVPAPQKNISKMFCKWFIMAFSVVYLTYGQGETPGIVLSCEVVKPMTVRVRTILRLSHAMHNPCTRTAKSQAAVLEIHQPRRGVTEHNLELGWLAGRLSLAVLHINRFAMFSPSGFARSPNALQRTEHTTAYSGKWEHKAKKNNISINKSSASGLDLSPPWSHVPPPNLLPQPMWGKSSAIPVWEPTGEDVHAPTGCFPTRSRFGSLLHKCLILYQEVPDPIPAK